jgi:hypothetical protein
VTVALLTPEQAELAARVDALDLGPIAYKLMHPKPGESGVTAAEAEEIIAAYRCFLKLSGWYRDQRIVPSMAVDEAWHTHILDTSKYEFDCTRVFGYFLHHFPYSGLGGPADEAVWRSNSARSGELFRLHFGSDLSVGLATPGGCSGECDDGAGGLCESHGDGAGSLGARPRPGSRPVLA